MMTVSVQCAGTNDNVETDSNGNLADTFFVPGNLKAGTYRVTVTDLQRRIGIADLTIPEPEIELDPAASQRGSTVVVIGSNFPRRGRDHHILPGPDGNRGQHRHRGPLPRQLSPSR